MELNYFKDILFDLINESDELDAVQIDSDEHRNIFTVHVSDGTVFSVVCSGPADGEG